MAFQIDQEKLADAKVLDRAAPPMKAMSYQAFPKMVYHHKRSRPGQILVRVDERNGTELETHVPAKLVYKVVKDQTELDEALVAGWDTKQPIYAPVEAQDLEEEAEPVKRGPGRPKAS